MKNLAIIVLLFLLISCSDNDNDPNTILPNVPVNETIFLINPEFIDLIHPGNWAYTNGGISGIIIYNSLGNYVAFERAAPHLTPQNCSIMEVEAPFMMCACDQSIFSILDGSPLTNGINYAAKQYWVDEIGNNTLRIYN